MSALYPSSVNTSGVNGRGEERGCKDVKRLKEDVDISDVLRILEMCTAAAFMTSIIQDIH